MLLLNNTGAYYSSTNEHVRRILTCSKVEVGSRLIALKLVKMALEGHDQERQVLESIGQCLALCRATWPLLALPYPAPRASASRFPHPPLPHHRTGRLYAVRVVSRAGRGFRVPPLFLLLLRLLKLPRLLLLPVRFRMFCGARYFVGKAGIDGNASSRGMRAPLPRARASCCASTVPLSATLHHALAYPDLPWLPVLGLVLLLVSLLPCVVLKISTPTCPLYPTLVLGSCLMPNPPPPFPFPGPFLCAVKFPLSCS